MLAQTHIAGGLAAGAAFALCIPDLSPIRAAALCCAGMIGGLIPDIDHPSSTISHYFKPVNLFVSFLFSHRGFFHTPVLYLVLGFLALRTWKMPSLAWLVSCGILAGIASHLFLDALNPGGIPLFFPFQSKRHHLARIRTGSKGEKRVRFLIYLVILFLVFLYIRQFEFPLWRYRKG